MICALGYLEGKRCSCLQSRHNDCRPRRPETCSYHRHQEQIKTNKLRQKWTASYHTYSQNLLNKHMTDRKMVAACWILVKPGDGACGSNSRGDRLFVRLVCVTRFPGGRILSRKAGSSWTHNSWIHSRWAGGKGSSTRHGARDGAWTPVQW